MTFNLIFNTVRSKPFSIKENRRKIFKCLIFVCYGTYIIDKYAYLIEKLSDHSVFKKKFFLFENISDLSFFRLIIFIYLVSIDFIRLMDLIIFIIQIFSFKILVVLSYLFFKKQKNDKQSMRLVRTVNPEYVPRVYVPDDWEVPRRNIELIRELGQGSFGMVYEGVATDIRGRSRIECAIKTVNEHATNR